MRRSRWDSVRGGRARVRLQRRRRRIGVHEQHRAARFARHGLAGGAPDAARPSSGSLAHDDQIGRLLRRQLQDLVAPGALRHDFLHRLVAADGGGHELHELVAGRLDADFAMLVEVVRQRRHLGEELDDVHDGEMGR